ncbi:MAG TPA: hypothetical protein VIK59_13820 [Verrucomicrobiae bacterium]
MNALIKKEIRLLLPAWIAAMLLAIFPVWIISPWPQTFQDASFLLFPAILGGLFLAIASFGQEFSFQTFSLLLSQPIPRRHIWLVKTVVLVVAFVSVIFALVISGEFQYDYFHHSFFIPPAELFFRPNLLESILIVAFVIFSGGLWTTLLLRQVTGAFWFTLILPVALVFLVDVLLDNFSSNGARYSATCIIFALLLFSIAGFFWARRMFLRAQDTQWTGGEICFPWRKKSSAQSAASFSGQPRHWLSALVRKEFQLHQATILIAALVLALHLVSVFIRKIHPNFENPDVKFILEFVWALWLLMPLLIGSAAVAEERRLGIIESQLCLPVLRRAQLFIKFSVALILSLVLGGLMPFIIERTRDFNQWIFVVAALIFFISFYASTLARTTLQAIGLAIVITIAIYFYQVATAIDTLKFGYDYKSFGLELLKVFVGGLILLLALTWLAFENFKWLHENWKLWRRNLIAVVLALAFSFALANGIYFRAWEFLTPINLPHGAPRLSDSRAVKFISNGGVISAILPDRRLWINSLSFDYYSDSTAKKLIGQAQFIDRSNWTEVAPHWFDTLAIKSDGTLWCLQNKWDESRGWITSRLSQMGSETNWSHVVTGNSRHFFLLKNDQSLWLWQIHAGYNQTNLETKMAADLATPPARIGNETNWSGLFSYWNTAYAKKMDGSFWTMNLEKEETNSSFHLIQNTNLNDQWLIFIPYSEYAAGVKTNGELWFLAKPPANWNWNNSEFPPYSKKIQLGKNEKWKAANFSDNAMVALRSDGTLWKWNSLQDLTRNFDAVKPVQLGNHSDWIVLPSNSYSGSIALAADGSLWLWDEPSERIWLAPSRKPVFIENIFQGTELKTE